MIVAFFESYKYIGHLYPLFFLRIFMGYYYFNHAFQSFKAEYLSHAILAEQIRAYLPASLAPEWYKYFLETAVIPNWQFFASFVLISQFFVGASLLAGYLVRPATLLAIFLGFNLLWAIGPSGGDIQDHLILIVIFTLGWLGAGRCLGVDYYFYRKRRGIWW